MTCSARPFDHDLAVVLPGDRRQLAQGLQLRELRLVVRVGDRSGRRPSPSENLTSCEVGISQISGKRV